jgi:transcriptional regulator EpsA
MQDEIPVKSDINLSEAVRADFFEIVEPTLHINSQEEFIRWTQTDLQRLFPHGKLVCGVGRVCKNSVHIRHVISSNFPQEYIQTLLRRDGLASSPILEKWLKEQQPILFDSNCEEPYCVEIVKSAPPGWLDNFNRFELVNLAAHGLRDSDTQAASYFSFSSIPGALTQRHAYLLKLLVPHLHAALTRVVSTPQFKKLNAPKHQTKLTQREREILQWLSTGKSNWEIAQVVGLSEATVKNHVYHIMGKLQATTRSQAVAKAISSRLISAKLAVSLCAGTGLLLQAQSLLLGGIGLVAV